MKNDLQELLRRIDERLTAIEQKLEYRLPRETTFSRARRCADLSAQGMTGPQIAKALGGKRRH